MLELLKAMLRRRGFGFVHAFGAGSIRESLQPFGLASHHENPAGLIVGNGRELWPQFTAALEAHPENRHLPHPLDHWVEGVLAESLAECALAGKVLFAHRAYEGAFIPLQRWAEAAGALALSPCHLSVHPEYGPWVSLRAFILLDQNYDGEVLAQAKAPCDTCAAPCVAPFELAASRSDSAAAGKRVTAHWQDWLAVRDACPIGRPHRYSEEQIAYHYARDRSALGGKAH